MGQSVEPGQRLRVGKRLPAQPGQIHLPRLHSAGKGVTDSPDQLPVLPQKPVVQPVAVDNAAAHGLDPLQSRSLSAAGAAGNSQDDHSSSGETIRNPAAFFSRFWTA